MKRRTGILLALLLVFALVFGTACSSENNTATDTNNNEKDKAKEVTTIRITHVLPEDHPTHTTLAEVFKPEVEKNSDGLLKIEIYPNAQLGSDRQAIEAVSLGSLEMTVPGGPVLSGFYEPYMVFDLPFLFENREAAYAAMDGELAVEASKGLLDQDIMVLGIGENGFRHITNNEKPIYEPDDLKGIKIRTMENPLHMAAFKGMGANPTPIAFGELFTALQQNTVDAQETPVAIIYSSRLFEVQKYLSLDSHVFANCPYLINKPFYESLDGDMQKVIQDAIDETVKVQRKTLASQEDEILQKLKDEGMIVNEVSIEQQKKFAKASQPAYDLFIEKFGSELIDLARSYNK